MYKHGQATICISSMVCCVCCSFEGEGWLILWTTHLKEGRLIMLLRSSWGRFSRSHTYNFSQIDKSFTVSVVLIIIVPQLMTWQNKLMSWWTQIEYSQAILRWLATFLKQRQRNYFIVTSHQTQQQEKWTAILKQNTLKTVWYEAQQTICTWCLRKSRTNQRAFQPFSNTPCLYR